MSHMAYITIHNLPAHTKSRFKTATFFRRANAEPSHITARMFYRMFENKCNARTHIEAMICSAPEYIELDNVDFVDPLVCNGEYHYHLDIKTMMLKVLVHEFWNPEKEIETIFIGKISDYINDYLGSNVSVVSRSLVSESLDVFTVSSMMNSIREAEEVINSLLSNPKDPVIVTNLKVIERLQKLLSGLSLSQDDGSYLSRLSKKVAKLSSECVI